MQTTCYRAKKREQKKREKKRENLEIRCCSPDVDPSPASFSALRGENKTMCRLLTEASWGDFFSPRGLLEEKTFSLPAQGEGTRQRCPYQTELSSIRRYAGAGAGGDVEKPLISKDDRSLLESLSSRM
ncbi:hypothetical protein B296_00036014 [Ensete ventricosum]|uniref:Uncharacterized protein n=1 Tax=Ensete ventricosum TaxID=4639 RepID=A0A426ZXN7_ENSVE|nr:hypothetical protein B296_00036014 [Ensete ventricosum]